MKPLTFRWIDRYRHAEHKPTTPDVVFATNTSVEEDGESEKSYMALTTGFDIFESYIFLYQSIGFMFLATFANIILFFVNTYTYAFAQKFQPEAPIVVFIQGVCYLIIVMEILSSVLHHVCKKIAAQRALTPRHWVIIIIDCVLQCTVVVISKLINWRTFLSFIEIFRLFRVFVFYGLISSTPGKHTVVFSLLKFSMVVILVIHIGAMAAQIFSLEFNNVYDLNWHKKFMASFGQDLSKTFFVYIYHAFIVLSAMANMGIVDASMRNDIEQSLSIIFCLFGMIYINGIFLGNYTSLRLNMYQIKTIYYNKLKLINKNLADYKVPKKIRTKIKNYYLEFWNNEGAIIHSKLVDELPLTLQYSIYLDKYWFSFENSNIFPNTHYGFKRALSYQIETRIYSSGETVYTANSWKNTMIYIHRGSVQVLSAEDMESPLITLSVGTIIGETSLIASYPSPLQIIAATYCVAYCIKKLNFWNVVCEYRKLQQGEIIHTKFRQMFDSAKTRNLGQEARQLEANESLISLEGMLAKAIKEQPIEGPKLLYVLSEQFGKKSRIDEMFLSTTFPWILNSNSRLIFYWDLIIVVFTFLLAIALPYVVIFKHQDVSYYYVLEHYMNSLFLLDVVLYLFVAIEDETGLRARVIEIVMERMHSTFILDIIAAIPLRTMLNMIQMDIESYGVMLLLPLARLVKFHKVVGFFTKVENTFKFNISLIRLIKYNIYLAFAAYIMAAIYYISACAKEGFNEDSWVMDWKAAYPGLTDFEIFMNTFKSSFEVVLLGGSGVLRFRGISDLLYVIVFISVGILMETYIAADYSATLTLDDYELGTYSKTMQTIQQLSLNPLYQTSESKRNMDRIYDYLSSQWYFNRGSKIKELLSDGPKTLYDLQQTAKYSYILENIPVFMNFGRTFCQVLATKCEEVQFSENTVFINEHEACGYMYIIDKGWCELIVGSACRIEKTYGPGCNICILEAMLGINNLFFVRSITCVALIRISKKNLQSVCRTIPGVEEICQAFHNEMRSTILYAHFIRKQVMHMIDKNKNESVDHEHSSFFVFPNDKTDPLYQDFLYGWSRFGIFRYVMLPLTIMPEGSFIIAWEILYNIFTFALVTVSLTYDFWAAVNLKYDVIMRALEVFQLIAIYVRFHICFYDKKGILISHPRLTGYHYLTGAFATDLFGVLPITEIYNVISSSRSGISACYNFNKLILMYRLPTAFYYFKRDVLKPRGITLNVCFFTPITITFLLSWVCIIIASGSTITVATNKQVITPQNGSVLYLLSNFDEYLFQTNEPLALYMITLYYTASNAMQLGCHGIINTNTFEVITVICILLAGYMIFTYVLVIIANSQTIINSELTLYQSHMKNTLKFMRMERVPKVVQHEAIQFYEYSWQQMHGLEINDVLSKCHDVLRADFLYDQYKNTFAQVSIFQNLDSTIYRELSRELTRVYMLPNVEFVKLNNIVSNMYIVHSGRINVYGPHGRLDAILRTGSIFGCLDNVAYNRSMVSFVSLGSVDLLEIETRNFYRIMLGTVINELQKYMLLNNLCYVSGRKMKNAAEEIQEHQMERKESWKSKFLNGLGMNMTFLMITFASILSITYVAAFYTENILFYLLVYTFDLLHLVFLILMLITPYHDSKGQLITDHKLIRRRVVRLPLFHLNLLALIPVDAIFLINMGLSYQSYIYRCLLLSRLLRIYNIASFFQKFNDILNSDLLIMKLLSIIVYTTLLLHFETCLVYLLAVRGTKEYARNLWAFQPTGNGVERLICGNHYICAFYFATSVLTFSGYSIYPRSLWGISIAVGVIVLSKFIMSITIAKLSACIQNYGADLARFDEIYSEMKSFLSRSAVSEYLIRRIVYYCEQLWMRSKGVQAPYLLVHSPSYLKEQIKIAAFGKHIYNNILFATAHPDFLRHLIRQMELQIFFKNDIICEQGDINETMYFIHSGNIDVLFSNETEVIKVDEIQELDCFGVIQGLYPRTPHTHTFKATTVTVLCTLSLKDWSHYLDFFPASKFEIYETLYNMAA